jgi:chromosome segregation ATPase
MLNAPEVPEPSQENEIDKLTKHMDARFNVLQESLTHIKEGIPTAAQLEARIAHLEHEQRRIEDKLDELWREHTRLANRLE